MSNNESGVGSESETEESVDLEEIEPKLKYLRMSNDLISILLKDAASSFAVHTKFVCLGTHWGQIYLMDHQGNSIKCPNIPRSAPHSVCVNQISIDQNGEFIGTCSDDGKVNIFGLYDLNFTIATSSAIKSIAIDPQFKKTNRFIIGDEHQLILYEKSFLRLKQSVLCESEGHVVNIAWNGHFIAWASVIGVRVYDLNAKCSLGLIKWEVNESMKCHLKWCADERTLLIGWNDTVRICVIRKRNDGNTPEYLVDPISTFQVDFYICGIAPLDHQLVLLGLNKKKQNNKSLRPQLYIIDYTDDDYTEICTDCLTLRGYAEYSANDYHLDVLIEENRFFIISPKDIVVASPYDTDDRIQWLITHNKYEEALNCVTSNSKYNEIHLAKLYINYLLNEKQFDLAAKICLKIFGQNKELWEEEIYKFANLHELRSLSLYLPYNLNPHIYEMVLYEYLKYDCKGFLSLIKKWNNCKLYNTSAVINAVMEHLLINDSNRLILLEALAILCMNESKFMQALQTYLKIKHHDIFKLIQTHNLDITSIIIDLFQLDCNKTIELLANYDQELIISKLSSNDLFLYKYLDGVNPNHKELIRLYAIFDRNKLLPLLKRSDSYSIQAAYEICNKNKYYPEMIFLLQRIGNSKDALNLIITQLADMNYAIKFCQSQSDPDLWNDLINNSINKPEFINILLHKIGANVDPRLLISKLDPKLKISNLKQSLIKMLCDYNLQVQVQDGCKKILVNDYFNVHEKLVKMQMKGVAVSDENVCSACGRCVLLSSFVLFNCKHIFHEECVTPLASLEPCQICHNKLL